MKNAGRTVLTGIALLCLIVPALAATSEGRQVPTETIVVPQGDLGEGAFSATPDVPPAEAPAAPAAAPAAPGQATTPDETAIPTVEYDFSKLPAPVKRLREQIMEAASTGDPEKLRPIIDANGEPPQLSYNDIKDPIDFIKSLSGDPEGREILAILIEVLEAGYVHADIGTPDEVYLWPYFARYPVDKLSPRQLVELFKLVYAGDYEDMKAYGSYSYYRVGIAPNGQWKFFIAGD
jgi:hypothetical protein